MRLGPAASAARPKEGALLVVVALGALATGAALAAVPEQAFLPLVAAVLSLPVMAIVAFRPRTVTSIASAYPLLSLATGAMAAGLFLVTFNGLRPVSEATVADILFLFGAGLLTLHYLATKAPLPRVPLWLAGAACGIFAAGLLSALLAPPTALRTLLTPYGGLATFPVTRDFGVDVLVAVQFSLTLLVIPVLIAMVCTSATLVDRLVDIWLGSVVINSLVALSDAFHLTAIGTQVTGLAFSSLGRETGLTLHPNHLSTVAAMALPVALSRATIARGSLRRLLSWVSLFVITAGIGVSGSRAGLLAGVLGIGVLLLLQRGARRRMVVGLAIGGAAALLFLGTLGSASISNLSVALDRLTGRADAELTQGSDAARRLAYRTATQDIAEHPVAGTGFGGVRDAHNLYLQLAQGGGLILICVFALFAAGALGLGYRLSKESRLTSDLRALAAALTASLAVWLVAGLVQNPIYDRYLYVPIGFLLGLSFLASAAVRTEGQF